MIGGDGSRRSRSVPLYHRPASLAEMPDIVAPMPAVTQRRPWPALSPVASHKPLATLCQSSVTFRFTLSPRAVRPWSGAACCRTACRRRRFPVGRHWAAYRRHPARCRRWAAYRRHPPLVDRSVSPRPRPGPAATRQPACECGQSAPDRWRRPEVGNGSGTVVTAPAACVGLYAH